MATFDGVSYGLHLLALLNVLLLTFLVFSFFPPNLLCDQKGCSFFRSYSRFSTKKFHNCVVALHSHICFPNRLVLHHHLNLHVAYPGSPAPETLNHTRGQFPTCLCNLFSNCSDQSLKTRSLERGS